jgi:hypothetical protein
MKRHYLIKENNYETEHKQQLMLKGNFFYELEVYSRPLVEAVKAKLMGLGVTA